jgi:hypothetical protein
MQKMDQVTFYFQEKRHFFPENWRKSPKSVVYSIEL